MSISLKDFKSGNFEKKGKCKKETQIQRILEFLKSNKRAYKAEEIAKKLKFKVGTVRHSLLKLRKEDEVTHKTPYFAYRK